jgi:predicted transcriptional regulator
MLHRPGDIFGRHKTPIDNRSLVAYCRGMPTRAAQTPKLGELESAVLQHLWQAGDADVTETHAAIGAKRGIAVNTVGSALERLFRKRLAVRWKVSHAYRYRPTLDRHVHSMRGLVDAAGGTQALASRGLLAAFVDLVAETDTAALDDLEQLIAERRRKREKP